MIKTLLFWAICFFSVSVVRASHILGADIRYVYKGGTTYTISANFYRDCRGIPLNRPTGSAFGGNNGNMSCGSTVIGFVRKSITDITRKCSSAATPCSPQNQDASEGIELHLYEVDVDISKAPFSTWLANGCCEISFAIGQCCRNGEITTSFGGDFVVTTSINICNVNKTIKHWNSAPFFSSLPNPYLCCNTGVYNDLLAIDTTEISDSFNYRFTPALQTIPNTPITYVAPYSFKYPLKPYCKINSMITCAAEPTSSLPKGIYMDSVTGEMIFTPKKCDEVAVVAVRVDEYRKDSSGKRIKIGFISRDIEYSVKDDYGYNNTPEISGPFYHVVKEGDKICFTIKSTDVVFSPHQAVGDTILLTWNKGNVGTNSTFTILNPSAREKEAEFCWQTKIGDAMDVPYVFAAIANDQNCPRPLITTRTFRIKVLSKTANVPSNNAVLIQQTFSIQPNPNNGTFSVRSTNGEGIREFAISDLNGRILYSQKTKDSKTVFKFNKSDLAKGVYLVTINKTVCLKMVINE